MSVFKGSLFGRVRSIFVKAAAVAGFVGAMFGAAGEASAHVGHAPVFDGYVKIHSHYGHPPRYGLRLTRCQRYIQGRIAWNYSGSRRWNVANLRRLCGSVRNGRYYRGPGLCFRKVMFGRVDWVAGPGYSTRWNWRNAVRLCAGARRPHARVRCFKRQIRYGMPWQRAIRVCRRRY
ncbi:MAG: hypothetical protein MRY74_12260 [Neomegalonema sp.]|nr:hypothetical protein [Neomegalonema sp.]